MGDTVVEVVGANIDGRRGEMGVCMCVNIRNQEVKRSRNVDGRWNLARFFVFFSYRPPLNTFAMCRGGGKRMVLKPSIIPPSDHYTSVPSGCL